MIKGAMRGYIIDSKLDKKKSSKNRNNSMLNMILKLMNVKSRESQSIIKEINTMNVEIDYITDSLLKKNWNNYFQGGERIIEIGKLELKI